MTFDLHRPDGAVTHYGDRARYSFTSTGHLVVFDDHGAKTLFSHHSWDRIEEPGTTEAPHP